MEFKKILVFQFIFLLVIGIITGSANYEKYLKSYHWTIYYADEDLGYLWYSVKGTWKYGRNFIFDDKGIIRNPKGLAQIGTWQAESDYFVVDFHFKGIYAVMTQSGNVKFVNSRIICGSGEYYDGKWLKTKNMIVRGSRRFKK
jgi:hypothetical protein